MIIPRHLSCVCLPGPGESKVGCAPAWAGSVSQSPPRSPPCPPCRPSSWSCPSLGAAHCNTVTPHTWNIEYCTTFYCTILYCTSLFCTCLTLYSITLYAIICIVTHNITIVLNYIVRHSIVTHNKTIVPHEHCTPLISQSIANSKDLNFEASQKTYIYLLLLR